MRIVYLQVFSIWLVVVYALISFIEDIVATKFGGIGIKSGTAIFFGLLSAFVYYLISRKY